MKEKIIFCWLGTRDERASNKEGEDPLGPIARALIEFSFHEVVILHTSDKSGVAIENYVKWLQVLLQGHEKKVVMTPKKAELLNSTDFEAIYKTACAVISEKLDEYKENVDLTFHSTPGSPAMTTIWILLAKSIFPAELIETHKDGTAKIIDIPFDISADFIPSLLKRRDQSCARLSAGLADDAPEFTDIIHRSETMQHAVLRAQRVAPHSIPILIEGESGTGKELFARAIHNGSCRKDKPFVAINCGAIPVELVESELFGHEKGAFTGAVTTRQGHFEVANEGTLFLDEIGELPKDMQVKLLRPLQENEIVRLGSTKAQKIDVRIIAATNRNLIDGVTTGLFREDLFYRLAVGVIKLPPLRDREGDIGLLIDHFMQKLSSENSPISGLQKKKISPNGKNILLRHSWPGNIRELQNTLTRVAVWSTDEEISEDDIREALLPASFMADKETILGRSLGNGFKVEEVVNMVETHYLKRGLEKSHGNKTKAAGLLGLSGQKTLTNWLKRHGLK